VGVAGGIPTKEMAHTAMKPGRASYEWLAVQNPGQLS
jgi:hypothetical protein